MIMMTSLLPVLFINFGLILCYDFLGIIGYEYEKWNENHFNFFFSCNT